MARERLADHSADCGPNWSDRSPGPRVHYHAIAIIRAGHPPMIDQPRTFRKQPGSRQSRGLHPLPAMNHGQNLHSLRFPVIFVEPARERSRSPILARQSSGASGRPWLIGPFFGRNRSFFRQPHREFIYALSVVSVAGITTSRANSFDIQETRIAAHAFLLFDKRLMEFSPRSRSTTRDNWTREKSLVLRPASAIIKPTVELFLAHP